MSELPISSPYRDRPDAPVEEDERERLSQRLKAAYAANDLDGDEFNTRLDRLWSAQRMGDLVSVVQGLPPVATHDQPAIVQQSTAGRPGELAPTRSPQALLLVGGVTVGVVALLLIVLLVLVL